MANKGVNILVIPDSHAHPQHDNERMKWLGEFILAERPDVVIHIGDMADMPSLSRYDLGTMRAWGRFYKEDIAAAIEHQEFLWAAVERHNETQRRGKRAQYKPRRIWIKGNHEERADRFVNSNPQFEGFVNIDTDLQLEQYWDEVIQFGDEIIINGMGFTHYYRTESGKAIAGIMTARSLVLKKARSVVAGHNHKFSVFFQDRGHGVPKVQAFTVGYYGHPDQREGWNWQEQAAWDFGVLMLYDVQEGMAQGGFRWITMKALEERYARRDDSGGLAGEPSGDDASSSGTQAE